MGRWDGSHSVHCLLRWLAAKILMATRQDIGEIQRCSVLDHVASHSLHLWRQHKRVVHSSSSCWLFPLLPCRELYTEKEVIGEERRARWENSPLGKFTSEFLLEALDNPYRRPVIGACSCLCHRRCQTTTALLEALYCSLVLRCALSPWWTPVTQDSAHGSNSGLSSWQ